MAALGPNQSRGGGAQTRNTYTPSPAVQTIVRAAPVYAPAPAPPPQNRAPASATPMQNRGGSPLRSNPVIQELLTQAVSYYQQPAQPVRLAPAPQPMYRMANVVQAPNMTLAQRTQAGQQSLQSQAFDLQIQNTKLNAMSDPILTDEQEDNLYEQNTARIGTLRGMMERVTPFEGLPAGTVTRDQREAEAIKAFPAMSAQEVHRLDETQLDALLDLTQPGSALPLTGRPIPVIGAMADGVRPTTRELQAADVGIEIAQINAELDQIDQAATSRGYVTDADRQAIVMLQTQKEELTEQHGALTGYNPQSIASGIRETLTVDGPEGSPIDVAQEVVDAAQYAWDAVPDPVQGSLRTAYDAFKSIAVPVADRAKWSAVFGTALVAENMAKIEYLEEHAPEVRQAFEALSEEASKPWREILVDSLNLLDEPRQYNVTQMGDLFYDNATGTREYDGRVSQHFTILGMTPFDVAYQMIDQFTGGEFQAIVVDAYENGYSSPSYIQAQIEAGIPPDQMQPQFTGGRAVWEAMVGQLDGLSDGQRMFVLAILDTVMDPLTIAGIVGKGGAAISAAGKTLRSGTDNVIAKGIGLATQGAGETIRVAAQLPDAPFVVAGAAIRNAPSVTGLLGEAGVSQARGAADALDTYERTLATAVPPAPGTVGRPPIVMAHGAGTYGRAPRRPVTPYVAPPTPTAVPRRPRGAAAGAATPGTPVTGPTPSPTGRAPRRPARTPGASTAAPGAGAPTTADEWDFVRTAAEDWIARRDGAAAPPVTPTTTRTVVEEAAADHGVTVTTGAPPPPPVAPRVTTAAEEPPASTAPGRSASPAEPGATTRTTRTETPTTTKTGAASETSAYPELARAEARPTPTNERRPGWRGLDADGKPVNTPIATRDTPVSASTGGSEGFLDDLATGAARMPDTPANAPIKQQVNDYLAAVDAGPANWLRNDAWYRNFDEGSLNVRIPAARLDGDARTLIAALHPNATSAENVANSYAKSLLTNTAIMQAKVDAAVMYRAIYDAPPLGTILPEPKRNLLPDGSKRSYANGESAEWLAWKYITTGDKGALSVLTRPGRLFDTSSGSLVPTKFPDTGLANEVEVRLNTTRKRYEAATTPAAIAMPDSFKRMVMDRLLNPAVPFAHPAVMAMPGLGLRAKAQAFADWFKSLDDLATRVADDTAIHVQDDYLRVLYKGNAIDEPTASYGSRMIPYTPDVNYSGITPGTANTMTVQEALEFVKWRADDDARKIAGMSPSKAAKYTKFDANAEKIKIGLLAEGLDATPKNITIAKRGLRGYDKGMSFYRNAKLAGPVTGFGGMMNDIIGNAFVKVISGNATPRDLANLSPWRIARWIDDFRALGRDELHFATTRQSRYLTDTGQVLPANLFPGYRGMEDFGKGLPPINAAVASKPWLVRALANTASVPVLMDGRRVTETMGRLSIYEQIVKRELGDSLAHGIRGVDTKTGGAFFTYLNNRFPGRGGELIDKIKAEANSRAGKRWDGGVAPGDVKKVVDEDAARAWQTEMNRASDKGLAESHRVYFTGKTTKADEVARRAFTFHYWQTRASIFHLRTATRNPILLNTYWKLFQDIEERSEGLPPHLSSMLKVFTSGAGISAAVNGFGYLLPMTALDATSEHGEKFAALFHLFAPMVQGILAVGGADYSPQLDPMRGTEKLIAALINQAKTDGVPLESIPFIGKYIDQDTLTNTHISEDIINAVVGEVNGAARAMLDKFGISIGEFEPFDREGYDYDLGVSAVQQVMEGIYGPRETWDDGSPEQYASIMDTYTAAIDAYVNGSQDNAIAQEAQSIVADQQLISSTANAIAPGSAAWNDWRFGEQTEANGAYAALDSSTPLTPAQQGALDNRGDATGGNILWNTMSDAYHNLGTDQEKELWTTAQMILNNDPDIVGQSFLAYKPDGTKVYISGAQLAAMSDDERKDWVSQWLSTWPGGEELFANYETARDDFLAANPEYQDYKNYTAAAYDDPRGFRTGLAATNPNFARAMEAQQEKLEDQGLTGEKLQLELDEWATKEAAFLAATGQDKDPIALFDPESDVTQNPNYWNKPETGGGSGGGTRDITQMESIGHGWYRDDDGKVYNSEGVFVGKGNDLSDPDKQAAVIYKLLEAFPEYAPLIEEVRGMELPKLEAQMEEDMADWQHVNQLNEQRYGDNWNAQTGEWETWASSEAERIALGLPAQGTTYPPGADWMREYWNWVNQTGNTSIADFAEWWYENVDRYEFYD